jgi:hypothetical protein
MDRLTLIAPPHPPLYCAAQRCDINIVLVAVVLIVVVAVELIAKSDVVLGFCHHPPIDDAFLPFFSFSFVIVLLVVLLPSSSSPLCLP